MKRIRVIICLVAVSFLLNSKNRCEPSLLKMPCNKKCVMERDGLSEYEYHELCDELKVDKDVVLAGMSKYLFVGDLPSQLKKDRDVAFAAARVGNHYMEYFDDTIKDDKGFVLLAVSSSYDFLKEVSPRLKKDRDVVIAAIKKYGPAIEYVDSSFRNDKELILMALANYPIGKDISLSVFDKSLGEDKEFMRKVIKTQPTFAEIASKEHFKDKGFVMELLDAGIYSFASKIDNTLLGDREVAYKLIGKGGHGFSYLANNLKEDREIVKYAVSAYENNYSSLIEKLRNDKEIAKIALSGWGMMLEYASDEVKADKVLVKIAIKSDARAFYYASDSLKDDDELATLAVSLNGNMFKHVSKRLKNDKTLVLMAVRKKPSVYIHASKDLRNDADILNIAKKDPWVAYSLDTGEIEHKIKPMAWKQYTVENTIEELYGKSVKLIEDTIVKANFDRHLWISTKIKVKSIAIMQERKGRTSLVSLVYLENESIKQSRIQIRKNPAYYLMTLHIVVEDLNGTLHRTKLDINPTRACMGGGWDGGMGTVKKYDKNAVLVKPKIGIKARYKDGVIILSYGLRDRHVTYDEAEKNNSFVNYISHIQVKNKDKLIYDMYLSQYNEYDGEGFFRFRFETTKVKKGDVLNFKIENIHGQTYTKLVTVK